MLRRRTEATPRDEGPEKPRRRRNGGAAMTSPTRVAQVITKFVAGAGGITLRGSLALDPDRFRVTILSPRGGPFTDKAEEAGLEVIPLRHMSPTLNAKADVRAIRELEAHFNSRRFDIVHTHSAKAGGVGRIAARRAGQTAIVHSFHGLPFHEFQSRARRSGYIALERRLARITDQFLTDGAAVAAEVIRLRIAPPERIRAIASPIDTADILPVTDETRAEARRRLGLPTSMHIVGTVGRLDYQKAPQDFVAAIAALQRHDVCVVWVGDGPLRPRIEKLIANKGLVGRVLLLGERDDVPALLPGFDVFAMSSLYEGLPCAIVEAMTSGVPVVATAVNSVPEVVIPGKTGLLAPPRDPERLAGAMRYALDRPGELARMAMAARVHLGDRFRPEELGRDLEEVYELALDRQHVVPSAPASPEAARNVPFVSPSS